MAGACASSYKGVFHSGKCLGKTLFAIKSVGKTMAHTKPFNCFLFSLRIERVRVVGVHTFCLNDQVRIPAFVIYDLNCWKNLFLR